MFEMLSRLHTTFSSAAWSVHSIHLAAPAGLHANVGSARGLVAVHIDPEIEATDILVRAEPIACGHVFEVRFGPVLRQAVIAAARSVCPGTLILSRSTSIPDGHRLVRVALDELTMAVFFGDPGKQERVRAETTIRLAVFLEPGAPAVVVSGQCRRVSPEILGFNQFVAGVANGAVAELVAALSRLLFERGV
jgi:hypothetical protein